MAGTTTKGLRFPQAGDNPAVHTDIQNLASDVDTLLDSFVGQTNLVSIVFEGSTPDGNETTLTVTDPTADRVVTIPDATGTVVLATATQTLTNKTLTSPVISTIVNSGTLTLPTSTGTIALTSDISPATVNENFSYVTSFMLGGM